MSDEPYVIPHRDAHDTELEAAAKAEQGYPRTAMRVLAYLVECGGDYDEHGAAETGMIKDSYAPARHYLVRVGLVHDSKLRMRNSRDNNCIVWEATDAGYDLILDPG